MSVLFHLFQNGSTLLGTAGTIYAATVSATAMTSAFSRNPQRRRDARASLALLLRRSRGR
ncbi:hypothetical protein [Streptomyces sp. CB01881]|uniref:hypothetical protein n=1 Tax=Streptomyces sp. CB01881 TaxID=2078691 RepID=UPI000CDBE207|nr:hypothetical protein [Streptomyces sp. CB01881]AUY52557.1 hypothetical protein C2142_30690 [Streptomyces sp. CB01881]TYC70274.1 hypothetical protein EH183_30750 [Streptomyces sp. CB01881]